MNELELIKKYNLDIESLKREQLKLAKEISTKDSLDFSLVDKFGAIDCMIIQNQIITGVIICDKNFNIIEQQYALEKLKFPYLNEFRSYRELPAIINAFNKLNEKPGLVFIRGHGLTHPRLGLASHFALFTQTPTIGITDNLFEEDIIKKEDIIRNEKIIGKVLQTKEKSNPIYISIGSGISLETAYNLTKEFIKSPHKLPEPLHLVHKYTKDVKKELKL